MKEYKIVRQKDKLKNTDKDFETELNNLARDGWRVISITSISGSSLLKVILEKDKNR